jgi:hypothetical protein
MGRLLRERGHEPGTPERARAALARVLGMLALTVIVGCLVTEQFEFATTDTLPIATAISPPAFPLTRVPAVSDPSCPNAMRFSVTVIERDPEQEVWVRLVTNGELDINAQPVGPDALGSELRTPDPLCAPKAKLNRSCNHVQMLISNLYNSIRTPPDPAAPDPNVVVLEWTVLGQSGEVPDAKPSDCVAPLMLNDAGNPIFPQPRDGGA